MESLTPELVIYAYRTGIFPMADPDAGNTVYWYAPDPRTILPLERFHVSRSLARTVKSGRYTVTLDRAFPAVIAACAAPRPGVRGTWISPAIMAVYTELHQRGYGHSVEAWDADGELAGGLYGVAMAGAFFGESMFHHQRDASKVALVGLVEHMRERQMSLLDVQFSTGHLRRFGVQEIPRAEYERRLARALEQNVRWNGQSH